MKILIRLEEEKDYFTSENITREAFWNYYIPGCDEHLYLHKLRKSDAFIKELAFVILLEGEIVGNIVFAHSRVVTKEGEIPTITFGPVSILPKHQEKGLGKMLINHAISAATQMGFLAIFIYGYPEYYIKYGFESSVAYNISRADGKFPRALLALPLIDDALDALEWENRKFYEGFAFSITENELMEFDNLFPYKEVKVTDSQKKFTDVANTFYE